VLGLQLAVAAWAAPPAGVNQTPSVEGHHRIPLANGLARSAIRSVPSRPST